MAETRLPTKPQTIVVNTGRSTDLVTVAMLGALAVGGYMVFKKYFPPADVDEGEIGNAGAWLASKPLALTVSDPQAIVSLNIAFTIERQGRPALGQGWYAEVEATDSSGGRLAQIIVPSLVGWGFENDPTQQVSRTVSIGSLPAGQHTVTVKIKAQDYPHLLGQSTGQYAVRNLTVSASSSGGDVGPGTGFRVKIDQVSPLQGMLVLQQDRLYTAGEYAAVSGVGAGFLFAQWHVSSWFINGREYAIDFNNPLQSFAAPDGSPITVQNYPGFDNNKSVVTFKVTTTMTVGAHYAIT